MTVPDVEHTYHHVAIRLRDALGRCAGKSSADCRFDAEGNVFLGSPSGSDTLLAGEVLSPSSDRETAKARYSLAGIPWYWEVTLTPGESAVATVRAHALETTHGHLPNGIRPLRPANYLVIGEWTAVGDRGIRIAFPFPIEIPWSELAY